jgi:hypothetical protein
MNAESEMAGADGLGGIETYDPARVYCPDCRGPAEPGSRNRISPTHVEYRCPSGHGFFSVREPGVLDPCAQIAESVGYSVEGEASMEALIDYKNALEDRCHQLEATLGEIGHCLPKSESWDGGPGRLEDIADILDRGLVERPNTSEYERH